MEVMSYIETLNAFVNPVVVCFCLVVGYVIKHLLPNVSNRVIPAAVVVVGIIVSLWINQWMFLTPDTIISGALSGLVSTGMHQFFKQWIEHGNAEEMVDTQETVE